mmetsp:Transcript_28699/g.47505  ORF Transcript_28699/g.47505 Transcript_28699/m.47505 type:complete len:338 (+) Transcript_28699:71-1084(+)
MNTNRILIILLCFGAALLSLSVALVKRRRQNLNRLTIDNEIEEGAEEGNTAGIIAANPLIVYGTAWKAENTARYVTQALHAGFRAIDTACQPKHYNESGVGDGWTTAANELNLTRNDVWLQTKFTPPNAQDVNNMPYDINATLEDQLRTSLDVSLRNLRTDYLDAFILHSPLHTIEKTMEAWHVMETFVDDGKVLQLGISNCYDSARIKTIYNQALRHKPSILQNRFIKQHNFDTAHRSFCKSHDIRYQGFSSLTGNKAALQKPRIKELATAKGLTPQTLMYAFVMSLQAVPLSGSTSPEHVEADVALLKRMQGGEAIFDSEEELREMAQLLGLPDL